MLIIVCRHRGRDLIMNAIRSYVADACVALVQKQFNLGKGEIYFKMLASLKNLAVNYARYSLPSVLSERQGCTFSIRGAVE